jgi:SPP1 gp7 family putative phage head morphogenesis protein
MPSKKLDIHLAERISKKGENRIIQSYVKSLADVRAEIEKIYAKYSTNGLLKYSDMTKSDGALLSRYETMYTNIFNTLRTNYRTVAAGIDKTFMQTFKEGYYYRSYDIQNQIGKELSFSLIPDKVIQQAAMNPISGLTLKEIQSKDKARVIDGVNQAITRGLVQGSSINQMDKLVREALGLASNNSERIARTESLRAYSLGQLHSENEAQDMGIKLVKTWLSVHDGRTRDSHQIMNGEQADEDGMFKIPTGYEGEGIKAEEPRMFGVASFDINCRCTSIVEVQGFEDKSMMDGLKDFVYSDYQNYRAAVE